MVIVVFAIKHRADIGMEKYEAVGARMLEILDGLPGFAGMEYSASDGHELVIARFESHEALKAWREHPEHREAQRLGREEFFESYRIEVCDERRSYAFDATAGDVAAHDVR